MILAGDIGGTSSRLAFFEVRGGRLTPVAEKIYPSRQYQALDDIVADFAAKPPAEVESACFGIPGPVRNGRVVTPNLSWVVDSRSLAATLGLPGVKLINDLEANAYGIAALEPQDTVTLNEGAPEARGNRAVISVGTGLGEAGLYWDGRTHLPFACEGGHVDFSPRDELEAQMMLHLKSKFHHVSYERVLSGPGLHLIYQFLKDTGHGAETPAVARQFEAGDPSAVISRAGLEGSCPLCVKTLNLFASLYGAEAGNLGLKIMATGGVFIGGGIAPKILKKLQEPAFLEAFMAKGRMKPLLQSMPVRVILRETTALLGAACCAVQARP